MQNKFNTKININDTACISAANILYKKMQANISLFI